MSDEFQYPYYPSSPYEQPQSFQPQQFQPTPAPVEDWKKLLCNYCGEEIVEGEESLYWLYGVAGPGSKSGRRMVKPSADIPEGEVNLHIHCISGFVEDSLPEAADEIRSNFNYECEEETEIFCSNCDEKIINDTVG